MGWYVANGPNGVASVRVLHEIKSKYKVYHMFSHVFLSNRFGDLFPENHWPMDLSHIAKNYEISDVHMYIMHKFPFCFIYITSTIIDSQCTLDNYILDGNVRKKNKNKIFIDNLLDTNCNSKANSYIEWRMKTLMLTLNTIFMWNNNEIYLLHFTIPTIILEKSAFKHMFVEVYYV